MQALAFPHCLCVMTMKKIPRLCRAIRSILEKKGFKQLYLATRLGYTNSSMVSRILSHKSPIPKEKQQAIKQFLLENQDALVEDDIDDFEGWWSELVAEYAESLVHDQSNIARHDVFAEMVEEIEYFLQTYGPRTAIFRVLPFELSNALVANRKGKASEQLESCISRYHEAIKRVIVNEDDDGDILLDGYLDRSIYGYTGLPVLDRASAELILDWFVNPEFPAETSGLGLLRINFPQGFILLGLLDRYLKNVQSWQMGFRLQFPLYKAEGITGRPMFRNALPDISMTRQGPALNYMALCFNSYWEASHRFILDTAPEAKIETIKEDILHYFDIEPKR